VTSSRYQVSTTSLQNIRARIGEGYTVEDLSLVVDYCNAKWSEDLTMDAYLRPRLFSSHKFPGYLKSAMGKSWAASCVNGEWAREDGVFRSSFQNTDYSKVPAGFRGANSSLLKDIQIFIANNPGLTNKEIAASMPEYDVHAVQRGVCHLVKLNRATRQHNGKCYQYFAKAPGGDVSEGRSALKINRVTHQLHQNRKPHQTRL
jgi:uncharacterized phage protein (TIGR02220 family)